MSKKCNFAFLLYPESCSPTFKYTLEQLKIPVYYILHDKDEVLHPETFEKMPKKPHYHVMLVFPTPRSENTAKKICLQCGGNGHLENIVSRKGYARYLMHLDEEYKHKYSRNEVITMNDTGKYSYDCVIETEEEKLSKVDETLADIIIYCKHNNLIAYCQLVDYCVCSRPDWLPVVRKYSQMIYSYLKSLEWYSNLC